MKLQYLSHAVVFYIFCNIHTIIHICGQIAILKIFLKLKNIFGANKFIVYAYDKKKEFKPP